MKKTDSTKKINDQVKDLLKKISSSTISFTKADYQQMARSAAGRSSDTSPNANKKGR